MRLQEAAAISLCGLTAAQALFFRMGSEIPFPWLERPALTAGLNERGQTPPKWLSFFIYGASTSVGLYAAQLVRQSAESSGSNIGLFGTAGPKHFQMLKAEPYGYDGLVDYHDEDWPANVRSFTSGTGLDYAYDCISEGDTVSKTAGTLARRSKMAIVRSREGGAWTAPDLPDLLIEPSYGAVWEGLGEVVQYQGMNLPGSQEARNFAVAFYKWLSEGGRLNPNPLCEMPGGLENIVDDGFRLLGSGTMEDRDAKSEKGWMKALSAEKLVYSIAVD